MTSSGFCLLNTVAVAAAYARYRYGREHLLRDQDVFGARSASGSDECARASSNSGGSSRGGSSMGGRKTGQGQGPLRIAIVDIDVHHGNGTEEIVRNLR